MSDQQNAIYEIGGIRIGDVFRNFETGAEFKVIAEWKDRSPWEYLLQSVDGHESTESYTALLAWMDSGKYIAIRPEPNNGKEPESLQDALKRLTNTKDECDVEIEYLLGKHYPLGCLVYRGNNQYVVTGYLGVQLLICPTHDEDGEVMRVNATVSKEKL